jgi:hypothetical protein
MNPCRVVNACRGVKQLWSRHQTVEGTRQVDHVEIAAAISRLAWSQIKDCLQLELQWSQQLLLDELRLLHVGQQRPVNRTCPRVKRRSPKP